MKIYQIDSSARKKGSTSRALAKKVLDKIKKPGDELIYRDLDDEALEKVIQDVRREYERRQKERIAGTNGIQTGIPKSIVCSP